MIGRAQQFKGEDPKCGAAADLFSGGGEIAALMRTLDWSRTPLGPVDCWPQSLRTSVSICLNSAFAILIWWGPELVMLYNDAYEQIISNKHPRALGSCGKEVFPEIWNTIGPMLHGVMERGEAVRADDLLLFLERNGYSEECYFTFSYSPILDEAGGVGGIFTPVQETTERVIGERRLRTLSRLAAIRAEKMKGAEEACRALAEVISDNVMDLPFAAIYLFDRIGKRARRVAVTNSLVSAQLAPELVEPGAEWPPIDDLANEKIVMRNSSFLPETEIPTGNWGRKVDQLVAMPIAQPGSAGIRGFVLMALNPRKRMDESYHSFLSVLASDFSATIADAEALEQERKRVEALAEIDRAKTVFFSNVSHEFRTPLTLILGPVEEMSLDRSLSAHHRARLELVQRNSMRLQKLVNNLLDFSRIESGRVNAVFEPVDLAKITQELASGFRSTFARAGLTLTVEVSPIHEPVFVDRDMWEKIVLNLISNAFKFTFTGGVTLEVSGNSRQVCLRVSDTGTGIPASELPKLFQRFHRIEGARGRSYEGSGIGLALVRELVKLHGGSISVESQEGVGTSFIITVPTGSAHLPAEHTCRRREDSLTSTRVEAFVSEALRWIPNTDEQPGQVFLGDSAEPALLPEIPGSTGRRRVILADDNADMRDYASRLLGETFEVETAKNGEEALQKIRKRRPDLLISDVMMPVLDGTALLAAIRRDPEIATLPVILLSARAGEEAEIAGLQAGADDYLTKPFSARELVAHVSSALQIAELRAASERALRTSESRIREVLERTTDAVFVLDREWRFTFLNCNAVSLIASGRDLLNKNIWEEFPEAIGREFWHQYQRVMNDHVPVQFEEFYPEPLGKWFDVHAYPTDEGIAVFFRDITEKRKAEQVLRQNEKLAVAGRLAASISHEINNPLEAVMNLLYLVEGDGTLGPQTRAYLETAQAELARVSHIASQTLRFYRQSTKPARTGIREILDSVASLYERRMQDANITLERRYHETKPIECFPGELRQLFANLTGNALDAIGTNGRVIFAAREGTNWQTGRQGVHVTVADTGQGMSTETRQHLFEPFFSTKEATGTGLGLWVSKEIVQKHGGTTRVRSCQGQKHGTVFRLFFPYRTMP